MRNRRLRSTIAMTEKWLQMSLSTSFLNGDVAEKVERSFRRREERGWMPRISIFSEKTGNQETNATGIWFVRSKKNIDKYVQYSTGSIWNGSAWWERDWCPESPMLTSKRRRREHCSTDMWIKDLPLTQTAPLDKTSVAAQSKGQCFGMWETNGLMTRIDIAKTRTICNRKLRSTIALFSQRGCSSKGRALISQTRGTGMDAPHLHFFRKDRKSGNKRYMNLVCEIEKKTLISTSNYQREASETAVLNEKEIGAPNRQCLPHEDVEGNTVLLTCESKTSLWHE